MATLCSKWLLFVISAYVFFGGTNCLMCFDMKKLIVKECKGSCVKEFTFGRWDGAWCMPSYVKDHCETMIEDIKTCFCNTDYCNIVPK